MLFNSAEFVFFLPIVFLLYWFVFQKHLRVQNAFVLIASYVFYGWWDWRFLGLIAFSSLVDFWIGLKLGKEEDKSKRNVCLGLSLVVNLGLLGFFKYFNFFVASAVHFINAFGFHANEFSLQLILPVGISFYTFQTMSYSIDVYRGKVEPTKDIVAFFAYVSFFPQLVAGPIERATNLFPQFLSPRNFSYQWGSEGMRWILWGLFKKVVVADNFAVYADRIFNNPLEQSGSSFAIGAMLFTIQVYMDFSGYSDIAIGTSRLFGFRLSRNFNNPFFSLNIAEFWSRWHISLTSWFRDYVYIPLGGSRRGQTRRVLNTFIVFVLIGLWHGAEWKYVVWGGVNAMFFIPLILVKGKASVTDPNVENTAGATIREIFKMLLTFLFFSMGCFIFRSISLYDAWIGINKILSSSIFQTPQVSVRVYFIIVIALFALGLEWVARKSDFALGFHFENWSNYSRYGMYMILITLIILFAQKETPYFYFQF